MESKVYFITFLTDTMLCFFIESSYMRLLKNKELLYVIILTDPMFYFLVRSSFPRFLENKTLDLSDTQTLKKDVLSKR